MRAPTAAVVIVSALLGVIAANATSACTFTTQGAGGDAAAPWNGEGGSGNGSGNNGASSSGSPNGNGNSGTPSTEDAGSSTAPCLPGESPCGTSCCSNGAPDSGAPTQTCTVSPSFGQDCQTYYADSDLGGGCASCQEAQSSSVCAGASASCSLKTCESSCSTSVTCGASCPAQYCDCISQCLQSQGSCCGPIDSIYACTNASCSSTCRGG
jgi:hypothetical protein